jgi:hypothetical protein
MEFGKAFIFKNFPGSFSEIDRPVVFIFNNFPGSFFHAVPSELREFRDELPTKK